jgi:4-diphosphocytidyl-2-C-methyl-D-erythritol kinase
MNATSVISKSPAKLNLFLHILGQRPDGYHDLQTVFQLVDLADTLEFSIPQDGPPGLLHFSCADPGIPLDNNLIIQAAMRLRDFANSPDKSASISLEKLIPMGAGLGGGSSNAATTLLSLNELWNTGLSEQQLGEIGLELGADVPVFIRGKSAWAQGVGELLEPIELPQSHYLIVWPGVAVSTGEIFSQENLTRDSSAIKIADFLAGGGKNDCESVVRNLYPAVDEALNWLGQFGQARLTGTGSCVFAGFENQADAATALAKVPGKFKGYLAKGINTSPMLQQT